MTQILPASKELMTVGMFHKDTKGQNLNINIVVIKEQARKLCKLKHTHKGSQMLKNLLFHISLSVALHI
jgi:hypothetical protein